MEAEVILYFCAPGHKGVRHHCVEVDDPKTFRAKKHIRGVRLHFIPESYEGSQPLYEGITYEKDMNFNDE